MSEDERREQKVGVGEALRSGLGVLAAFRDAIEETVQEAVERGDLNPERARRAAQDAVRRAGDALGEVRERWEAGSTQELDALRVEVGDLRRRIEALERSAPAAPPLQLPPGDGEE
ncbi:MAG: hypothetical protein M3409_08295 [Gemmatimonadota bacterium]|nr:hypothetical protein [Gemmatimonadota bacterium]